MLGFVSRLLCTAILLSSPLTMRAAAALLTDPVVTTAPASQPASAASRPFGFQLPPPFNRIQMATPAAATQPSAPPIVPVAADDPQRSPRATVKTFLLALNEAKTRPARIVDAVAALDLSNVPAEDRAVQGPLLAQQLGELIGAIFSRDGRSTEEIPEYTRGPPHVLFAEGELGIIVAQQPDGRWRFTADSVAAIPQLRQSLTRAATTQPAEPPPPPDVPPAYRSARATMATFIAALKSGDMQAAARTLDLSALPAAARDASGRRLASRLKEVMDRVRVVVVQDIPDRPDGNPYTFLLHEKGRIEIARKEAGDRKGEWLFTAETVASIESLFTALEQQERVAEPAARRFWQDPSLWVRDRIPPELKHRRWGVETWQWYGLLIILLVSFLVQRATRAAIRLLTVLRLGRNRIKVSRPTMTKFVRPFGWLALLLTCWGGLQLLDMPASTVAVVWPLLKFAIVVAAVWAAYRLIDLVSVYMNAVAERTLTKLDDVLVPLLRKTLKIILLVIGVLVILQALGVQDASFNTAFAGLGLGGLAFALAAQDTLKNFFGSVTVVIDRPFQVGDWIKVGDVEGEVQSVGLRSTRLRTAIDSELTVPNANLINANVDNLGRRIYRRFRTIIRVTCDTPVDALEAFCEGIRELIRRHPYTRKDSYHVYVNDFGESSIHILLQCFHRTPDWGTELREQQRLLLDVIRLAERLGVAFAYPTRTVHVTGLDGATPLSAERTAGRAAASPAEPQMLGRNEAAAIVAQLLPPTGEKPPPVTFEGADKPLSPSETRFL